MKKLQCEIQGCTSTPVVEARVRLMPVDKIGVSIRLLQQELQEQEFEIYQYPFCDKHAEEIGIDDD